VIDDLAAWRDRLAVQDLVVRCSDAVTRGAWDQFESVWTADAVWEESEPVVRRLEGARTIREQIAASLDAVDLFVQTTHGSVVTLHGVGRATATTTIIGVARVGDHSFVNVGIYFDDVVRGDDGWRFAHRRLQNLYADTRPLAGRTVTARAEIR
jgi:hypothetical protein